LSTSGWGLGDTSSDNNTKPASLSGFDFSDLEAALDAMNKKPASTSTLLSVQSAKAEKEQQVELNLLQAEDESIPLPGFYLDVAESQIIENRIEKQNGKSGGGGGRNNKEEDEESLAYIHELLEQYGAQGDKECLINYDDEEEDEDDEETRDKKSRKQKPAPQGGSSSGRSKAGEETADPITWDGEGYEEDAVLAVEGRKGVDQSFLKFMKKLQRIPDQCVRQGRERGGNGGDQELLLWPSSKKIPEPGVCSSCGASRVFEYQLMAPTIAAIEESADWLKEEGLEDGAVERPPVSWDWVTVAVFGCRERCSGGSDGMYREEKVVVCEEE
jgi:hypothetical protein